MKLQKQLSREFAGKQYPKWVVVLPPRLVSELGWKEGLELRAALDGQGLRLRPAEIPKRSR